MRTVRVYCILSDLFINASFWLRVMCLISYSRRKASDLPPSIFSQYTMRTGRRARVYLLPQPELCAFSRAEGSVVHPQ